MSELVLKPTSLNHVFQADIDDTGLLKEIVVLKKYADGTLYYLDVSQLHPLDKGRIKKIVTSPHADKYECWELFSQSRLSNGINALDFFHANMVKVKRPKGARASSGSLADVRTYGDKMIGAEFVNPAEANLDKSTGEWKRS